MSRVLARLLAAAVVAATLAPAAHAEIVYAVSNNNGRIIRFDSTNPADTVVTLSGTGLITAAAGLALGPDGNLYVGESGAPPTTAPSIRRLDLTTNTLSTVYTFNDFSVIPGSLAFKGNDLLVGRNPFFGDTGAIAKIANATGGTVGVTAYTTGGNLASSPGLALAADGTLYVSDQTYNFGTGIATGPVKRFDAAGNYVGEVIASGSSGLAGPTGLVVSGSTLFTTSIMAGTILQTNLLSDATGSFATAGSPFAIGTLAQLADGSLLAGNPATSGVIYRFNTDGTLASSFASGLGAVGGIAVAPVPEPSTVVLAAVGVAGIVGWMRRRRSACRR